MGLSPSLCTLCRDTNRGMQERVHTCRDLSAFGHETCPKTCPLLSPYVRLDVLDWLHWCRLCSEVHTQETTWRCDMKDYPIAGKKTGVDPADRQQRLGEVYAFLIDLARQKRAASQAASDPAKHGH